MSNPLSGGSNLERTHWGAIGFTLVVAAFAFTIALPRLTTPIATTSDDQPSAVTNPLATPSPTAASTAPPADTLASAWVSQTPFPMLSVGGSAMVSLTFRNTGEATWVKGTPSEVRLALVGGTELDPAMSIGWPFPGRPAVQREEVVAPDQTATFSFEVQGTRTGTYLLRLRPVVDGVAWLNDEGVFINVIVR